MDSSEISTLFQMKFKASVKKLEELLTARDIQNAIELLDKMQKEANRDGISAIDGFSRKLKSIHERVFDQLESRKEEFETLYQKFMDGSEAILCNQFQNDQHKKETIEFLNVQEGMAIYNSAKKYREELIKFRDWFEGSDKVVSQLLSNKNILALVNFLDEFYIEAKKIEAKELLKFISLWNQTLTQEKTHNKILFESYQKSINL